MDTTPLSAEQRAAMKGSIAARPHGGGTPRIFISHGTQDPVLRIDGCSRRLVPQLERAGYDARYVEFSGGHTVPENIAEDGIGWFLELPEADSAGGNPRQYPGICST
jgi:predicted esterase